MHTPASILMGWCFAPLALCWCSLQRSRHSGGRDRRGSVRQGVPEQRSFSFFVRTAYGRAACRWFTLKSKSAGPCRGPTSGMLGFELVQGMVRWSSLFLCGAGIILASVGVRCWTDIPLRSVAAAGGLLVALAGVLSLAALGVYTHNLSKLGIEVDSNRIRDARTQRTQATARLTLQKPGRVALFGWVGACVQVLGGACAAFWVQMHEVLILL